MAAFTSAEGGRCQPKPVMPRRDSVRERATPRDMRASTFAAVVLRIATGIAVGSHGLRIVLGGAHTMSGSAIADMGFPAPHIVAWLIAIGELTGFLLALGIATRITGAIVAVTMAGV